MSKVTRLWHGDDSTGRSIEVVESTNGKFYSRAYEYNGYSNSWSKWKEIEKPKNRTRGTNAYTLEIWTRENDDDSEIEWGFSYLEKCKDVSDVRYRLPN